MKLRFLLACVGVLLGTGIAGALSLDGYARVPLHFEANEGQVDAAVDFVSRGQGYTLFLQDGAAVLSLRRGARADATLRMDLVGGHKPTAHAARQPMPSYSNYYRGGDAARWHTGVGHFGQVQYDDVYPGVDLVYYGNQRRLEYDFVVAPGVDPDQIALRFDGAEGMRLDATGNLLLNVDGGEVALQAPIVYQQVDGARQPVDGAFVLSGDEVRFALGEYDTSRELVIDPILSYATFLGGAGATDIVYAIDVDASGHIYLTGSTGSTSFPVLNEIQTGPNGGGGDTDGFVTKLTPDGQSLVYSTYLGGSVTDVLEDIVALSGGEAAVVGNSGSGNFPTFNGHQPSKAGGAGISDAVVVRLDASGQIAFSTFLGGSADENPQSGTRGDKSITTDGAGNIIVSGTTLSTNFPVTVGAYDTNFASGSWTAFVTKYSPTGAMLFSSFLGANRPSGTESSYDVAADGNGHIWVAGVTNGDFPVTGNAYQPNHGQGPQDAFLAQLSADGTTLLYATYLGGNGLDNIHAIALDASDNIYLKGRTESSNFPVAGASIIQANYGGAADAFVSKFDPTATSLVYSTYLGGNGDDASDDRSGIAVDGTGNVIVAGRTGSSNFPLVDPFEAVYQGAFDAYVTKINAAGGALVYSTYLGGQALDRALGVATNAAGDAYVAGYTASLNFPTQDEFQGALAGGVYDGFVAKISTGSLAFSEEIVPTSSGNNEGVAMADYDGDGDLDVFVAGQNTGDRLYENDGSGNFADVAGAEGVADGTNGRGAAWGDYDNDGDPDLYLTRVSATNVLYTNNSNSFSSVGLGGGNGLAAIWVDYDSDGDLDIFGGNDTGSANHFLFRNDGGGSFVDRGGNAGFAALANAYGADWADFDNDGDLDLYIANYQNGVEDQLFRNDGGGNFADVTASSPIGPSVFTVGAAWADFDNDGDMDIYVAEQSGSDYLYQNNAGTFSNVANALGINNTGSAQSVSWADFDNDGDLDVYVGNGVNNTDNRFYVNNGGASFSEQATALGLDGDLRHTRGLAWGDVDNDGDIDLFVANTGSNQLFRNQGNGNNYLHVDLEGSVSSRDGIGARLTATIGGNSQILDVDGGGGYQSQNSQRVAFGLGAATVVDQLRVDWPSGIAQTFVNVAANQVLAITEANTVTVTIPDVVAAYDQTVSVPVQVSETAGANIIAAEVFIQYDGDLLTPTGVDAAGTLLTPNWAIEPNIVEGGQIDTYKIAMATDDDALAGAGVLINVLFQVPDVRAPSSSALTLSHALFNNGTPLNATIDGSLTVGGASATITSLPAQILPDDAVTITVVDADEDSDGAAGTDQVVVDITNSDNGDNINLTLNEDGAIAGTFSAAYSTGFGAAAVADALIQADAGDIIVATYSDVLDAAGNTTPRTAQTTVLGGNDGSVAITLVSQPGDPLYVQVSDLDLNADPGAAETATVTLSNSRTAESFVVTVTEVDLDDEVFFGSLATIPGASTATEMHTAEDDVVTATYDDAVATNGGQVDRTAQNDVIFPWGDTDDNDALQAFDAAQVLIDVLSGSTYFSAQARLVGNVDIDPVATGITPFDAALILQKRVERISSFPVQDPASTNNPQGDPASPKLIAERRALSLVAGAGYVSLVADERGGIISGDLLLAGVEGRVEMGNELGVFLQASRLTDDGLRIVFAGPESAEGPGELLRVYGVGPMKAAHVRAEFNDGAIAGVASGVMASVTPGVFVLHPNVPNPFNPSTAIHFELPQRADVRLAVYDLLGQKVRTLVAAELAAGAHRTVWDGRDAAGRAVGNGVYFYRLQAGEYVQMRRMLLLK